MFKKNFFVFIFLAVDKIRPSDSIAITNQTFFLKHKLNYLVFKYASTGGTAGIANLKTIIFILFLGKDFMSLDFKPPLVADWQIPSPCPPAEDIWPWSLIQHTSQRTQNVVRWTSYSNCQCNRRTKNVH